MDSLIDCTQSKKKEKIQLSNTKHWSLQPPPLLPNNTHSVIPVMYFSTSPQQNTLLISHLRVCVHACVCGGRTALSLCFYIPALLLLALWGPISQLCCRSINPDRSIVLPLFTDSDQRLALRYHFQLEKHSCVGTKVDLKWLQQLRGGTWRSVYPELCLA